MVAGSRATEGHRNMAGGLRTVGRRKVAVEHRVRVVLVGDSR